MKFIYNKYLLYIAFFLIHMNLLPYIPFLNYRQHWKNKNLNKLKSKYTVIKDDENNEMGWSVIDYYLLLAYDEYYFNIDPGEGLRMSPNKLHKLTKNCSL